MKLYFDENGRSLYVEDATQREILGGQFRNFRGEKRKFNDAGRRNFNLVIPPEFVEMMKAAGCNVKMLSSRDEDDEPPIYFVKINVAYGQYPPHLYLVANGKRKELDQNELGLLDSAVFKAVDLVINTYHRDEGSCSLYLQSGFFNLRVDPITAKYEAMNADFSDEEEEPLPF